MKRQLLLAGARRARRRRRSAQRVLVCSPLPGEGKTFCAINLALAIAAEKDSEVAAGRCRLRQAVDPLGARPAGRAGLMDALADPRSGRGLRDRHRHPGPLRAPRGQSRPARTANTSPAPHRRSARPADAGRAQPDGDLRFPAGARRIARGRAGQARRPGAGDRRADHRPASRRSRTRCRCSRACPDIKLLLNAAHFSPSGRRFGTYYGYGE